MTETPPPPEQLSAEQQRDLLAKAKARKEKSEPRLETYRRCEGAYFGERLSRNDAAGVRAMDSAARTLLQAVTETRSSLVDRGGAPNFLPAIVDDFTYLRGSSPSISMIPPTPDDEGKEFAHRGTRILRAQWEQSSMAEQLLEGAWYLTCKGECPMILTPVFPGEEELFTPPGVYITVHDPSIGFPRFRTGIAKYQLDDLFIIDELEADVAEAEYHVTTTKRRVESVHYLGRTFNALFVDEDLISYVPHGLGFCPAEWLVNKRSGGRHAQSDIAGVLDQHEELQVMMMVMHDAVIDTVYSQLIVKDPINVNEQFEVGPGAKPIVVQGSGGVTRLQPASPPQGAEMIVQQQWENILHQTGTAPVRVESRIEGSNISGRAINAIQGPMETRLAGLQTLVGAALRRLNSKIVLMLSNLAGFQQPMELWGIEQGAPFHLTFQGDELKGWHRSNVEYGAMIGSTNHERIVMGLQLMGQQLVPGEWVLQQIGVDDPELRVKEAESQALHRAKMAAEAQQQAQPQPGGDPAAQQAQIMAPAEQGQSLAAGATPPHTDAGSPNGAAGQGIPGGPPQAAQPPPGLPNFPAMAQAPQAPPSPGPQPTVNVQSLINRALMIAGPNLKGHVISATPQPGDAVLLAITDNNDKNILRLAFRQVNLAVRFRTVAADGLVPA